MTQIGNAYGQALYALAREEGLSQSILGQLQALDESFRQEPAFLRLMAAPNIEKKERCDVLDESFRDKVHPYVLNFLKILTEKGYARYFSDCCKAYIRQYHEDNGILPVCAITAVALNEEQTKRLADKLSKITEKIIELTNRIDPKCLGGVRLDYDGKRVDGTVQSRLEEIRALLKNTVL